MKNNLEHISEAELLLRYKKTRDNRFLTEAMLRYTGLLFSICLKYIHDKETAKDIVQEVLIKGIERLPEKIDNLGGWLYMITRNECINHLRNVQKIYYEDIDEAVLSQPIIDENDEFKHWKIVNNEDQLIQCIASLKEEQKICIELFFLKNKTYQEISDLTHFTYNEIKSYIQNGKRNLKIKLEEKGVSND